MAAGERWEVAALAEDVIRAAGAVVWRAGQRGVEIVLVHRPKYDDWSLPKGKLSQGEHVLVAAVREVREETGQRVALRRPLPTQRYIVEGRLKEVHYWAATLRDDRLAPFTPNREVDEVRWLPAADAKAQLTHPRDADLVDALPAGPLRTIAIVLLRHGKAVERTEWDDDDRDRPLTEEGLAEAEQVADLLDAYAVTRVRSSDARRCLDTVRPYAERFGLQIEIEPMWSETGFAAHRAAGLERVGGLLASDEPTVVSGHRPVLPELAAELCRGSDIPPPTGELEVGGFWVLHVADRKVTAIEHHEPASPAPVSQLTQP